MSGTGNVGEGSVYEAGDQRNVSKADAEQAERFKEGQPHSHKALDSKDERSIANKLERESQRDDEGTKKDLSKEDKEAKIDSTLPARNHGNEPSKGAKIDQELREEEEEILKKKGGFGPKGS